MLPAFTLAGVDESDADLAAKVEYLSRPAAYAGAPAVVERIETHFAWVFIAGDFVYKLKKPLRFHDLDLRPLTARRASCELEVALNRRLTSSVYLGTVALCRNDLGLSLGGPGRPVDWLVHMRRLPRERTLDRLAASGELRDADLAVLIDKLATFYGTTTKAAWDGPAYRAHLLGEIDRSAKEFRQSLARDRPKIDAIASRLRDFVERQAAALDRRVGEGRVVDAHGDLRPEHVFLTPEPQIIDCLEFSAELRVLDTAAEIAFLTLECARLGHPSLGSRIRRLYERQCHDAVAPPLYGFYTAERAFVRGLLAAWRLRDGLPNDDAARWRRRAHWYLDAAAAALSADASSPIRSRP